QGTVGLEFVEQVRSMAPTSGGHGPLHLDAIIVPVGGGGLLSGVAVAAKGLCPGIRIIGAEPEGADDASQSKASGTLQGLKEGQPDTVADGLKMVLGSHTWPIVRDVVDEIVTVKEEEILRWMAVIYQRLKLVIEPSAAVGVAALMSEGVKSRPGLERVGVVLCGGNVSITKLIDLLARVEEEK
ncbi:unnamed protein product, partial [Discosporangium mesarthrocarpum]